MKITTIRRCGWMAAALLLTLGGCTGDDAGSAATEEDHAEEAGGGVIEVPPSVRRNLGIEFVTVERRPVQRTVRVPGEFELTPDARREYHAMLSGRVELLVQQYERVEPGQVLLRIDSPDWRGLQGELSEAIAAVELASSELEVAEAARTELEQRVAFLEERLRTLAEAQVRKVELEADVAELRNRLPRLRAEARARSTALAAARTHYDVLLRRAAALTRLDAEALHEPVEHHAEHGHEPSGWHAIELIELRAEAAGIVDTIAVTNGGWLEPGGLALITVDPSLVRFRAKALQSDIEVFQSGLPAQVVPPQGGSVPLTEAIEATLLVGFRGDAEDRTIPLYAVPSRMPSWARPGVAAWLEVVVAGEAAPVLAVPESSIVRDGLELVLFRRDPQEPNRVLRVAADLGVSDGRWVAVRSGLRGGDEVVLEGAYELMLASAGRVTGGHFHADGTFHEEAH